MPHAHIRREGARGAVLGLLDGEAGAFEAGFEEPGVGAVLGADVELEVGAGEALGGVGGGAGEPGVDALGGLGGVEGVDEVVEAQDAAGAQQRVHDSEPARCIHPVERRGGNTEIEGLFGKPRILKRRIHDADTAAQLRERRRKHGIGLDEGERIDIRRKQPPARLPRAGPDLEDIRARHERAFGRKRGVKRFRIVRPRARVARRICTENAPPEQLAFGGHTRSPCSSSMRVVTPVAMIVRVASIDA